MLAIAPDDPAALAKMVADQGLSLPVLRDAEGAVMKSYGIVNADNPRVPHPTVVIVDRRGTVRWVHLNEDYRRRPPPDEILAPLQMLGDDGFTGR